MTHDFWYDSISALTTLTTQWKDGCQQWLDTLPPTWNVVLLRREMQSFGVVRFVLRQTGFGMLGM